MNNKIIIGVVAIIIIAAGAYFMFMTGDKSESAATPAPAPAQTAQTPGTPDAPVPSTATAKTAGTLGTLLAMGSVKCDVTIKTDNMTGNAVVYVNAGKMRNEITANGPQGEMHMTMINDSKDIYTWGDAMPQGIKMSVAQAAPSANNPTPAQSLNNDTPVEYSCEPWTADNSKFVAPTNVKFMELGAMPALPKGVKIPKGVPQLQ